MPPHTVGSVQLLNCARGHMTTISTLRDFARKTENLICLIQEPWCDRHGNPPLLPNFNLFLTTPTKPRCATYVRQLPRLSTTTTFTAQDSFLGTTITLQQEQHTTSFTIFNLYSPGRPEPLAALLPSLNIPANCLIRVTLMRTTLGGRAPCRTQPAPPPQAMPSHTGSNTTTSTSKTNQESPPTIQGMEATPPPSTYASPTGTQLGLPSH